MMYSKERLDQAIEFLQEEEDSGDEIEGQPSYDELANAFKDELQEGESLKKELEATLIEKDQANEYAQRYQDELNEALKLRD